MAHDWLAWTGTGQRAKIVPLIVKMPALDDKDEQPRCLSLC